MSLMTHADRSRARGRALVVGSVLLLLTLGSLGAASAYWSGGGGGAGSGGSATVQPVTLTAGTPAAQLYPGGSAAVTLTATNPNSATVRIVALALDTTQGASGYAVDTGHSGCTLSTLGFATQTNAGAGWNLPASGSLTISLPTSLTMGTAAESACQGARFTVYLQAST